MIIFSPIRIANNQKHGGSEESGQEDENDDWNYAPESKRCECIIVLLMITIM